MAKRKCSPASRKRQSSSSNKRSKPSPASINVDESDTQSTRSRATGSQAYVEEVPDSDEEADASEKEDGMMGNEPESAEDELGE